MTRIDKFLRAIAVIPLLGLLAALWPVSAQDAKMELEVVWKADTTTHSITDGLALAVDGLGNLYVTDWGADGHTYQIHKFDQDGKYVMSWGSTGKGQGEFNWRPANPDDGPDAGFIAADAEGNVYVSDGYNFRVQKFDTNGKFLYEWGSQGEDDGQFVPPSIGPITVDPTGNIYVSDFAHVQLFDSDGKFLSSFGSFGTKEGEFQGAAQVSWDSHGNLYVADLLNARFQVFDAKGKFLRQVAGEGEQDGKFHWPLYVAVDSQDHVFVTDNTNRLQAFDTDGKFIAKWTEPGNGDGPFEYASSVVIDGEDNLFVSFYRKEGGNSVYKLRQK